jgi:hypothetical protein
MKIGFCVLLMAAALLFVTRLPSALAQSGPMQGIEHAGFTCSPVPCVLPPTQASEGGGLVTNSLIVTNPLNQNEILLGSVDFNCDPSSLGFHLSRDGGSSWERVLCMPFINQYRTGIEPSVGYDRNGIAYVAGDYYYPGRNRGLVAVQQSGDGSHWSKPVVALRHSGDGQLFETHLTVDTNAGSLWVNSVYISGVLATNRGRTRQVVASHSSDAGHTWTQVAVDTAQSEPIQEWFTRLTVGSSGTVYLTWVRCHRLCSTVHMMFSKSSDVGNAWSPAERVATAKMPVDWALPNTSPEIRAYNYPVIAVDNSSGPYSGNLYVAMYTWTGTHLRVQVIRSTDDGKTWSKPVPLAPPTDTHDQFFPSISVSSTGLVGVSWLDRRNDPANHNYQAFAAISNDGGKSFGRNWQLTKAFSDPDTNGDYNWMGDYMGNTWAGNKFIAAWMDSSNGVDMQEVVGGVRLK